MNDNIAIRVSYLGKKYNLGGPQEPYNTFRDLIINSLKAPVRIIQKAPPKKEFWALKNVSFEVEKGEIIGIIGKNGAGKSTLLKILSRITTPTEGNAEIHGRIGSLLEVGTGFHPELTGRENIFLSGSVLGMKKTEIANKFDEIVKFSEIEKFINTPVKRYSSGMYVRLAFAVAAHLDTEILLVDEVLAVGDSSFQKKCLGKMKNITNEGRTILFVSHNMGAISSLCNDGLLLESGKLETIGNISDVIERYFDKHHSILGEVDYSNDSAPGDNVIKLKSVKIFVNGNITNTVPINENINIEIKFLNYITNTNIHVSLHLLDKNGYPVLATGNLPSGLSNYDPLAGSEYPKGLFKSTCVIPKFFLNDGVYYISVFILTNTVDIHVKQEEVIAFSVYDTGEMRKEYTGSWIGVVRPRLEWHTDHITGLIM